MISRAQRAYHDNVVDEDVDEKVFFDRRIGTGSFTCRM